MTRWMVEGFTVLVLLYPLSVLYHVFLQRYFFSHRLYRSGYAVHMHYVNLRGTESGARFLFVLGSIGTAVSLIAGKLAWQVPVITIEALGIAVFARAMLHRFLEQLAPRSS